MSFCTFQDAYALFDCTPLENMFIQEYMLRAPGDFVKVYIYGLMQCYHPTERMSLASMAKDLGMDEETVFRAFQYWERQGAVRRVADNPPAYAYKNLKQAHLSAPDDPTQNLYAYRDFNEELHNIFSGKRRLYQQDYDRIYSWIETLGLPQEVVLMLLRHCIDLYKIRNFSFEKADKMAQDWAKTGVMTIEDVEAVTRLNEEKHLGLRRLLRRLGQKPRDPSEDEEALYHKWTKEWGFSPDAILEACKETTKGVPTMAYLDAILSRQHQLGARSAQDVTRQLSQEQERLQPARRLLAELGRKGVSPTPDDVSAIQTWQAQGFELEAILLAAQVAHRNGGNSLESVAQRLEAWRQRGLFTRAAAEDYMDAIRRDNARLEQIYAAAGMDARPNPADRRMLRRWTDTLAMPQEVVLLAAAYAAGTQSPIPFMDKILQGWAQKGVRDALSARREHEQHGSQSAPAAQDMPDAHGLPTAARRQSTQDAARPVREVAKHRYDQRTYSAEELDALFFDIMKEGEDDA